MICSSSFLFSAPHREDTLYTWRAKFSRLGVPKLSPGNKWLAIKKFYLKNSDTVFIIDTQNQSSPAKKILCSGFPTFLNDEGILGLRSNSKAEFLNLWTNTKYEYSDVKYSYILEESKKFALLTKDNRLQIYNLFGEKTVEVSGIDGQAVTDSKSKLYFIKQNNGKWEAMQIAGDKIESVYSPNNPIKKIELSSTGKHLFITETTHDKKSDKLTIVDTQNPKKEVLQVNISKNAEVNFTAIENGKRYFISAKTKFIEKENPIVDIWYGNDSYLTAKSLKVGSRKYWLWNLDKNKAIEIKVNNNAEITPLNNDRYFISYIPREGYNYITDDPELNNTQLFDFKNNSYKKLGNLKRIKQMNRVGRFKNINQEIVCSPDGKRFLASYDGIKWILFKSSGEMESLIDTVGLEQPIFSAKGDFIYFESSDDLWKYDVKQYKIKPLGIGKGKMTRIKNQIQKWNSSTVISYLPSDTILVENYDKKNNVISYGLMQQDKWQTIIPPTENKVNDLLYDHKNKQYFTVEENFNIPHALYKYSRNAKKTLYFDGYIKDIDVVKIKQEILSYSAIGADLNGILYYPKNFDPVKKYPMVVHIYEVQRQVSNEYLSGSGYNKPVSFQIRTLLEKGYFVYLPDIIFGAKGTGLSALECVNNAMSVVFKNPNIDSTKVALIGHSHGGYETNFISTHSNRFATYISGAGNSDIIRSYYSYNYNFNSPFYWQFETKQYNMGTSVAEDKDRYLRNSPILNVDHVNAPILLWSGREDENIVTDQVMEFYIGLRRYKKDVIALFYPAQGHSFDNGSPADNDLNIKVLEWFDYFLKNKRNVPWINLQMKKDAFASFLTN